MVRVELASWLFRELRRLLRQAVWQDIRSPKQDRVILPERISPIRTGNFASQTALQKGGVVQLNNESESILKRFLIADLCLDNPTD